MSLGGTPREMRAPRGGLSDAVRLSKCNECLSSEIFKFFARKKLFYVSQEDWVRSDNSVTASTKNRLLVQERMIGRRRGKRSHSLTFLGSVRITP